MNEFEFAKFELKLLKSELLEYAYLILMPVKELLITVDMIKEARKK